LDSNRDTTQKKPGRLKAARALPKKSSATAAWLLVCRILLLLPIAILLPRIRLIVLRALALLSLVFRALALLTLAFRALALLALTRRALPLPGLTRGTRSLLTRRALALLTLAA
jgi:hypothetical protein